jgi:hypothetical protein
MAVTSIPIENNFNFHVTNNYKETMYKWFWIARVMQTLGECFGSTYSNSFIMS